MPVERHDADGTRPVASSPLGRRLQMIAAVAEHEAATGSAMGVVELAELMQREKTQVSRGLRALQAAGVLDRDGATLGFRVGPRLLQLAARAGDPALLRAGRPVLAMLAQRVAERAQLVVRHGVETRVVASMSPDAALQAAGGVGRIAPATGTAAGRALLLDESTAALVEAFGRSRGRDLKASLDRARARGYVRVEDEPEPGLTGLAVPVRDPGGAIVAALEVSAPTARLAPSVDEAAVLLREAAEALAAAYGAA